MRRRERNDSETLPPALRAFQNWTILLFLLSLAFTIVQSLRGISGYATHPFSTPIDRFGDFTLYANKFRYFHSETFFHTGFPFTYPAPCALAFEAFFRFARPYSLRAFLCFCVLAFVVPAIMFALTLKAHGVSGLRSAAFVTAVTVFSWPALLLIDRGNIEVMVWVVLAIGMWAYATGRLWLAAAFFAIGASLKLFPFVLFGLFLSRRQYAKIVFGAAVFLLVSGASFAILGPTIGQAYRGISFGLQFFKTLYMGQWRPSENGVDHSVFALLKGLVVLFLHRDPTLFHRSLTVYLWTAAVGGLLLYFLRIRFLPLLNQVLLLTIVSIYFTAFSGDGTLIHLYYPCVMLFLLALRAYQAGLVVPGLRRMLGYLVFILSIETFFVRRGQRFIGEAHCIVLGLLFLAALKYPLGPPLAETGNETILSAPDLGWLRRDLERPAA